MNNKIKNQLVSYFNIHADYITIAEKNKPNNINFFIGAMEYNVQTNDNGIIYHTILPNIPPLRPEELIEKEYCTNCNNEITPEALLRDLTGIGHWHLGYPFFEEYCEICCPIIRDGDKCLNYHPKENKNYIE